LRERLFCVEREEPIWGGEGNARRSFGEREKAVFGRCWTMEMVELRGKMWGSDMAGGSLALWFWESKSQGPRGARLVLVPFFKWGRRLRVKEKKGL
jgi:hypothetical protein